MAIAACGSSGPATGSSGPAAQSKRAGALVFANCMRSHGVLWYRLMLEHLPLNEPLARELATLIMKALQPS